MEYFVDAKIRFKNKKQMSLDDIETKIEANLKRSKDGQCIKNDEYEITQSDNGMIIIELYHDFEFYAVSAIVKAAIKAGLTKYGRDKLIAYQTCAECYFKNYVTKDGEFLDFCGDCIY